MIYGRSADIYLPYQPMDELEKARNKVCIHSYGP
jgi:hypothetical protein